MQSSLKKQTVSGVLWSAVQKFGTMAIAFVSNIILARLLSPDDYGVIGMLMIFIVVANTFVDGGFGSALIQKKEPTQEDYSTIFWWNLLLSIVLYCGLFIAAPYIAKFYNLPLLSAVLRVQSVVLILNSLSIIQQNRLRKTLLFKKLATVSIISSIISLIITIYLAYNGWGVWALVAHQIIISLFNAILYGVVGRWLPSLVFSKDSFKQLFGFGGFILLSNLINNLCNNIQGVLIGKFFTPSALGYYTQAHKLETVVSTSLSNVVEQVSYPILAKFQSDNIAIKNVLYKILSSLVYITMPILLMLIIVAEPAITLLYGAKWAPCIPYLRILCIVGMSICLQHLLYYAIASKGKSKDLLVWTFIKRIIGLIMIFIGMYLYDINGILWGFCASAWLSVLINAYLVDKHIGYTLYSQIRDLFPCLLLPLVLFVIVFWLNSILDIHMYLKGILMVFIYITLYVIVSEILRFKPYIFIKDTLISFVKK